MGKGLIVTGVLSLVLASCARIPAPQEADDAVLALRIGSWPALMIVLSGIVPTFAWRARAEETLLSRTFGKSYAVYRRQTKMIIPYVL